MNTINSFENPDEITEKPLACQLKNNEVELTMPARSVVTITLK